MTRKLFAALPLTAALVGGATMLSAETIDAYNLPSASEFAPIQRYAITYDHPRDVAEFYVRDFGFKNRDAEIQQVDHPSDESMRILFVTVNGIQDDAVKGIQMRIGVKFSEGAWEAAEAGMRRMCYRGANTEKWTRDPCP